MNTTIDEVNIEITSNSNNATTSLDKLIERIERLEKGSEKGTSKLINFSDGLGKIGKILSIGGIIASLGKVGTTIGKYVNEAANYDAKMNAFTVSMGSYANRASKFADEVQSKMGYDAAATKQYLGEFDSLIKGFGLGEERAYVMSQNLTQLSYDMAALKQGTVSLDDAMKKLKSGISGKIICLVYMGVYTVIHLIAGKSKHVKM